MNSDPIADHISDDSSDWSSAEEVEDWKTDLSDILCLFCSQTFESIDKCFAHLSAFHNLDLIDICVENKFNSFDFIKLINYIRLNKPESNELKQIIESKAYESEKFMKPVITDDQLLTFDIESQSEEYANELSNDNSNDQHLSHKQVIHKLRLSEQQIKKLEKQLSEVKSLVNDCMSEDITPEKHINVSHLSASEDWHYMSSYSHFSIHYEMLSDKSRTKSYENSILKNNNFFKDKTVLDIGCGTGILSMFAAKAGAKLVVAVDQSDIVYKAMDIAIENRLDSKIRFIKDRLESIDFCSNGLPNKYDIIISEWMGYFLLFEGMLDSILFARNCLLNASGVLLPNKTTLTIAGISDEDLQNRFINFWDNVYGFKMSSMKSEVLKEALIENVSQEVINTRAYVIKSFDLMECNAEETQSFETNFHLVCTSNKPLMAIVGWFDCVFNGQQLEYEVILSTSPYSESTHWKQTVFILKKQIDCKIGDKIEGNIKVYRNLKEIRSLIVEITIDSQQKQVFYLS